MTKLSVALALALAASASAFVPQTSSVKTSSLASWDPLSFGELSTGKSFDTFPTMFPDKQYLQESEIKQGRMSMLAWTGIWATHQGGLGLGMHFPGAPVEPDWTKALGVFSTEQPEVFGAILLLICIAEGESVGHTGDNWKGLSTKEPGNLGFDYLGLKSKLSSERQAHYKNVEIVNGRAAMIAMASMFAFESIPGSVPIMDLLGAQ